MNITADFPMKSIVRLSLNNNDKISKGTALKANREKGKDKFLGVYPKVDWTIQLNYAEEIDLGSRKYELIEV